MDDFGYLMTALAYIIIMGGAVTYMIAIYWEDRP